MDSTYSTGVNWVISQPVPFSHKHHAGELGIDCRYCHTSVETSARAGLPATHICMTCHSQIWTDAPALAPVRESFATGKPIAWNRVAQLPDFVFFNHSIHVNRGVPCVTCHGRVDQMPLTSQAKPFQMQWCLSCHRNPAPHLRPPAMVTRMDWSGWTDEMSKRFGAQAMQAHAIDPKLLDNCGICHR
ncbi:cytochrome c3 family protein [Pedomonas mirosovicensis]|uniref:cytochrome c3 family protein n=1 Tax=Pedomonas mirosovicensis TaxID=2908641 RepID=UPI00216A3FBA|nr:cytochrome c3 family protein [Pedomonas mirosovicensis]MCH8686716.1 cytochrome c family protein [Pedomonas mirosovicensis]